MLQPNHDAKQSDEIMRVRTKSFLKTAPGFLPDLVPLVLRITSPDWPGAVP